LEGKIYYRNYPAWVFTLAQPPRRTAGVPIFETLGLRIKRDLEVGGQQKWRKDEWPPQRIIETYRPATWPQKGGWGYQNPIYMLNRIIRLQTVIEIITNQTASALELLAKQQTQM
jgi:hypothetical protein